MGLNGKKKDPCFWNLRDIQDHGYTEPPHRCANTIQEIMEKIKKATLIIVVILGMLAELLQDKFGSVSRRKFCDKFVYLSE